MTTEAEELVTIYESQDEMDADFIRAYLVDYGFHVTDLTYDPSSGVKPAREATDYVLQVPHSQASEATKFIVDLRNAKVDDSEIE